MAARSAVHTRKVQLEVCIGKEAQPVGQLAFVKDGNREYSVFTYSAGWLSHPARFAVSPDLALAPGYQVCKPPGKEDSRFFFALADTEPDAWGRRVIARAHAKARKNDPTLKALTELDYLCAVDDFSRIGALRLRNDAGFFFAYSGARSTLQDPLESSSAGWIFGTGLSWSVSVCSGDAVQWLVAFSCRSTLACRWL